MSPYSIAVVFVLLLVPALLLATEAGFRLGRRGPKDAEAGGTGAIDGAIFALLGLLLAFTFSGAASRFDDRRALVAQESNAIGTAYLRLDLLPAEAQPALRALFRDYVDARLAAYADMGDAARTAAAWQRSTEVQRAIWAAALAALGEDRRTALQPAVLGPINEMIDITTTRHMATLTHPPMVVFVMLGLSALLAALLAGVAMGRAGRRAPLHAACFALMLGGAVYLILDLEFPRLGLIRVDGADVVLHELRRGL
jgi:hypothetical protein